MAKVFALVSEYLATFLLVLSILITNGNVVFVGVTLAGLLALTERVSGGYINPAVSVAMYIKSKISLLEMILFSLFQIGGAITSVYIFKLF